jgi:magnesium and cobalt transporter
MNEPAKPSLLERLSSLLLREPEDREQLIELLHHAFERKLLDAEALSMIEGVLQVSETQVRDVMIPRSQTDMIDVAESPEKFIPFVIEKAHSRFPVFEDNRDNVIGILLAKDLLRFYAEEEFNVREMLRPAVFVPEAKRLNVLLKEFRGNRNHMAIVVDEYGGVAGLITIEDVIEQIVGEIDDEFDVEDDQNIRADGDQQFAVRGATRIAEFNEHFGSSFDDAEFDTIAGLVMRQLGRVPRRGETVTIGGFEFRVLRTDRRRIDSLRVSAARTAQSKP